MKDIDPRSPIVPFLLPPERRRLRPQIIAVVGAIMALGAIGAVVINAQGSPSPTVSAPAGVVVAPLTVTATATSLATVLPTVAATSVATPVGAAAAPSATAVPASTTASLPPTATVITVPAVAAAIPTAAIAGTTSQSTASAAAPPVIVLAATDTPLPQATSVPAPAVLVPTATWTPLPSATATPTFTPVRTSTPTATATASPVATTASLPSGATGLTSLEQQMFDSHNQQRAQNGGLPALHVDSQLEAIARYRAKDMATRNYFSHYSPDNATTPAYQILMQQSSVSFSYAGENIGENNYPDAQTVAEAMDGFMNSPGHRENILRPQFTRVGIGEALGANGYKYFAVVFAGP